MRHQNITGWFWSPVGWQKNFLIWLVVCSLLHKLPSYSRSHRSPLGSPAPSPSGSTVPHVPPSWRHLPIWTTIHARLSPWSHVPTLPCMPPYVSDMSSVTRSINSPSLVLQAFPQALRTIPDGLALSSLFLRLGCTRRGFCSLRRHPVSFDRLAVVGCILLYASPWRGMKYLRPVQE